MAYGFWFSNRTPSDPETYGWMGLAGQEAFGLKGLVVGGLRARVHWIGKRGERMVGGPGSLSVERFEGSSPLGGWPSGSEYRKLERSTG